MGKIAVSSWEKWQCGRGRGFFLDWRQQVLEFSVIDGGILLFCFLREEIVKSVPRSWRRIKLIGFATLLSQYFYLFRRAQE
jgi:hypothetical protein